MNLMELKNIKKLDLYLLNLIGMTNLHTHTQTHTCAGPDLHEPAVKCGNAAPKNKTTPWRSGTQDMKTCLSWRIPAYNTTHPVIQTSRRRYTQWLARPPLVTSAAVALYLDLTWSKSMAQTSSCGGEGWGPSRAVNRFPRKKKEKRKSKQLSRDVIMVKFRTVAATRWTRKVDFIFQARD